MEGLPEVGRATAEEKNPGAAPGMEEELLRLLEKYNLIEPSAENWQVLI